MSPEILLFGLVLSIPFTTLAVGSLIWLLIGRP